MQLLFAGFWRLDAWLTDKREVVSIIGCDCFTTASIWRKKKNQTLRSEWLARWFDLRLLQLKMQGLWQADAWATHLCYCRAVLTTSQHSNVVADHWVLFFISLRTKRWSGMLICIVLCLFQIGLHLFHKKKKIKICFSVCTVYSIQCLLKWWIPFGDYQHLISFFFFSSFWIFDFKGVCTFLLFSGQSVKFHRDIWIFPLNVSE